MSKVGYSVFSSTFTSSLFGMLRRPDRNMVGKRKAFLLPVQGEKVNSTILLLPYCASLPPLHIVFQQYSRTSCDNSLHPLSIVSTILLFSKRFIYPSILDSRLSNTSFLLLCKDYREQNSCIPHRRSCTFSIHTHSSLR